MFLVTGSSGLIGRALISRLRMAGQVCVEFDLRGPVPSDTRDVEALRRALVGVRGVIHLAAVSRVVWAQNDPRMARAVNVDATRGLIELLIESGARPWLIFASSREVYGEPHVLPVREDAPMRPMNVYAETKVAGEGLAAAARDAGLCANIVRLSNVYGSVDDHADRVVPAFARAAATGGVVRLEGPQNTFDFTHVDDVSRGICRLIEATSAGERLEPIHLLTGQGTTLERLAQLACANALEPIETRVVPARNFDVSRFYGDAGRADALLGWKSEIDIDTGFSRLAGEFRGCLV